MDFANTCIIPKRKLWLLLDEFQKHKSKFQFELEREMKRKRDSEAAEEEGSQPSSPGLQDAKTQKVPAQPGTEGEIDWNLRAAEAKRRLGEEALGEEERDRLWLELGRAHAKLADWHEALDAVRKVARRTLAVRAPDCCSLCYARAMTQAAMDARTRTELSS
jgi:hypothetical protein